MCAVSVSLKRPMTVGRYSVKLDPPTWFESTEMDFARAVLVERVPGVRLPGVRLTLPGLPE